MDLGLRQGHRYAKHAPALIRAYADGREHVRRENDPPDRFLARLTIAHDPAMARLLVACVEDEILDLAEGAIAARAASSSSSSLVARLTCEDDRLSIPNSAMMASTSRVETPLMYISATASSEEDRKRPQWGVFLTNARTERRPRSRECG